MSVKPFYLLDTNVVSEINKVEPDQMVLKKIAEYSQVSAITSITWSELQYGQRRLPAGQKSDRLFHFIYDVVQSTFPVISFDEYAGGVFAGLRIAAEEKGKPRPLLDLQIAAMAISNNMILVTRNIKDFEDIPGLNLENWFSQD